MQTKTLIDEIEDYWEKRAPGYSEVNQEELNGVQKGQWLAEFHKHLPLAGKHEISILDVGTGPGFFSIILAEDGYRMTAVDYTEAMLQQAKANAGNLVNKITWHRMDAQNLDFADETFDVVISRNLTWNLEKPGQAYREWHRVLKQGGILLNFDANWYHHLFDEEKRAEYEADREKVAEAGIEDHYTCTDIDTMEEIARKVPLSQINRPSWDKTVLTQIGFTSVEVDTEVWNRVLSDVEKVNYASTPVFMIKAYKGDRAVKSRIVSYWQNRSESFLAQRRNELASPLEKRWWKEFERYLPEDHARRRLRILDAGTGAGFFAIMLGKAGHKVTGIDITPGMIEGAKKLAAEQDVEAEFFVMDAENPDFPPETFDMIITRNLTWTLPHPEAAYREWTKLLKPEGIILNFDADYGSEVTADTSNLPKYHAHHSIDQWMLRENDLIKAELHISKCIRPLWDFQLLTNLGYDDIKIDTGVYRRIYVEKDEFYNPTPIFALCATKHVGDYYKD